MNSISVIKRKISDRGFFYAALLCLFLTTFPLAQGWIAIGDFIPRVVFLALALVMVPTSFASKDFLFLILYFLYSLLFVGTESIIGEIARLMEFIIPIVLANYLFNNKNIYNTVMMARFAIVISIIIMINSSLVEIIQPDIIRMMVKFSAEGDTGQSLHFLRMGVCIYSFAMISMCLAPVFLYLIKNTKYKFFFTICLLINIYFVYISGITTCLMILIIMIVLFYFSGGVHSLKQLVPRFIIVTLIAYFFGLAFIELVLPYLEDTNYYTHFAGLLELYGKETIVTDTYDVEGRTDLYKYSMETFLANPVFGSATGKIGGHNFFLDHFARLGIVGMTPFVIFLYIRFKQTYKFMSLNTRIVYLICVIGFLIMAFLKGINGIDFWTYMFLYIPCILKYGEIIQIKKDF